MYLDYSKLEFDKDGIPEYPELVLETLSEDVIGVIPGVSGLKFSIKFAEPSEIEFDITSTIDGEDNWIYEKVVGYKIIYTKYYGIYVTLSPTTENDGIKETKHVKGYSIERMLDTKKFFLEGSDDSMLTLKFYDLTAGKTLTGSIRTRSNEDILTRSGEALVAFSEKSGETLMGRIFDIAVGWKPGYISPSVAQRYRSFDQYDDYLLNFIYGDAQEKFRCVFVFDPYERTINVYDADTEIEKLPIYLDFENLVNSVEVEEIDDELKTAVSPYGADSLNIIDVNPTGTNWIYDLSYFIANGDIPERIAQKYEAWKLEIMQSQAYYKGLVSLRASTSAKLISEQVALTELTNEREVLIAQQSVVIQSIALEATESGKARRQVELDKMNQQIAAKDVEIFTKNEQIAAIQRLIDPDESSSYAAAISAVVNRLAIKNYFSSDEYEILSKYIVETDITEDSFIATESNLPESGGSFDLTGAAISISDSTISYVDMRSTVGKQMYSFSGGTFQMDGTYQMSGDIIRGTLEVNNDRTYVFSLYAGNIEVGNSLTQSALITISGTYTAITNDVHRTTEQDVVTYIGKELTLTSSSGTMYVTSSTSDYQQYAVKMDLLDYAENLLKEIAVPTYEFSISSGNFIFAEEFEPYRKQLQLGKGIFLNLFGKKVITPYIIEFTLDFEDRSNFTLTFSNRFKLYDGFTNLKDQIEKGYSSGRDFDATKYLNKISAYETSQISQFMSNSLEAARQTILAAANQSVVIDGAGVHIGGDSRYQMRLVDRMLAMTDDNWQTVKTAIGLFNTPNNGIYFGINAEVIAGKLIVGNELIIDTGNGDFRIDSSGVHINSMRFYITQGGTDVSSIGQEFDEVKRLNNESARNLASAIVTMNGTIDSDTEIYYQAEKPTSTQLEVGDIWYLSEAGVIDGVSYEAGSLFRYELNHGSYVWNPIDNPALQSALDAASEAQVTADGKSVFLRQNTVPSASQLSSDPAGDIWFNTSTEDITVDGITYKPQKLYRHNGVSWDIVEDGDIVAKEKSLQKAIEDLEDDLTKEINKKITTWYQNTVPNGDDLQNGDLWFVTENVPNTSYKQNELYRYNSSSSTWVQIQDAQAIKAIADAKDAKDIADNKVNFWRQSYTEKGLPPTDSHSTGDLWYNTATTDSNGYIHGKLYRYSGTGWELVEDSSIQETKSTLSDFYKDGYLQSSKLSGAIDAQQAWMKSATGNVIFDKDGIWLMNASEKSSATTAVWMNEEGIIFGTGPASSDPGADGSGWHWTTAINHSGITADALAGKTISGLKMYGGELYIGPKSYDGDTVTDWNFKVDNSGNLTANTGTFRGTVKGATFQTSGGQAMMGSDYKFKSDYLNLLGLDVGNGNFVVDEYGNVSVSGTITMGNGSSIDWGNVSNTNLGRNPAYSKATNAESAAQDAQNDAESAIELADIADAHAIEANTEATRAKNLVTQMANGTYEGGTFIDGTTVSSPYIVGGEIRGVNIYGTRYWDNYDSSGTGTSLILNTTALSGVCRMIYGQGECTNPSDSYFSIVGDRVNGGISMYLGGREIFSSSFSVPKLYIHQGTFFFCDVILTEGFAYGSALPSSGTKGQVFFVTPEVIHE